MEVSGFRVVSRESLKAQDKSYPLAREDVSPEYGLCAAQVNNHLDTVSPCATSCSCIATKSSYKVLPKDDLQVDVSTPRAEAPYWSGESADGESELE